MEKHGPRRGFHGHSGGPCRPMKTPLLRRPVIWAPGYSPCRHREGILGSASAVSPPKQVSAIRRDRQGTTRPMSSGWHRQWCPDEGYLAEVENAVILRGSPLVTVRQTAGGSPMVKLKRLALRLGRYLTEEKGTASRGTNPVPRILLLLLLFLSALSPFLSLAPAISPDTTRRYPSSRALPARMSMAARVTWSVGGIPTLSPPSTAHTL